MLLIVHCSDLLALLGIQENEDTRVTTCCVAIANISYYPFNF